MNTQITHFLGYFLTDSYSLPPLGCKSINLIAIRPIFSFNKKQTTKARDNEKGWRG